MNKLITVAMLTIGAGFWVTIFYLFDWWGLVVLTMIFIIWLFFIGTKR